MLIQTPIYLSFQTTATTQGTTLYLATQPQTAPSKTSVAQKSSRKQLATQISKTLDNLRLARKTKMQPISVTSAMAIAS